MDALARCERSRDALVQRLLEAMAVLGRLQGQVVDLDAARSEMSDSIAQLEREAAARSAATAEIAELLDGGTTGPRDGATSTRG
jgi:hypothetical protein